MTVAGRVATNPVGTELTRPRAAHAPPLSDHLARRVVIDNVRPRVDEGRFPIKRTVGESVEVIADIFADGHDMLVAVICDRHEQGFGIGDSGFESSRIPNPESQIPTAWKPWCESPLTLVSPGTDEWRGAFAVDAVGWHEYLVVAWVDRFRSWRRDLQIKAAAGQDLAVELLEGSLLIREAAERAVAERGAESPALQGHAPQGVARPFQGRDRWHGAPRAVKDDAAWLLSQADALSEATPVSQRVETALGDELGALMDAYADRSRATMTTSLRVWVDRERARFGAWYEMFPRSAGRAPDRSGTFRDAAAHLPYVADLGFDVVYLPPIHPIGTSFRKGRNNSLMPAPADPGSPWAIGSEAGGHTAIEPGLGTMEDFQAFCREAERLGLEVALDLAWQCSPDHPWVREHPEWFRHRPDGTIKYAENPPKKYQDIYPLDFECDDWRGLWRELVRVTLFWVDRGVRIFRVDNPHTKTFGFWEWMIAEVHARDPHVIFLSEAFTRPKVMLHLAKVGFTQSYTYFTWRNTKDEIAEYFTELTGTDVREYLRPTLFTNTPDILHAYLQEGGRPAFEARLILAATLGASYGIYSGFELCENRAVPGTEEYADSEKYQFRRWDWNRPGHIKELVARVNAIRHQHRALQADRTLRFHATDNPQIIAYSKSSSDRANTVFVVVNLDPHHMQHGWVQVLLDSLRSLGAGPDHTFTVRDLIDDAVYTWHGGWNYVRFDPGVRQGHIFQLVAGG